MFFVFLGGYNSYTTEDIKLEFSAFLSCVEVTKCVNFQISRLMGFKVGIFRISPIKLVSQTAIKVIIFMWEKVYRGLTDNMLVLDILFCTLISSSQDEFCPLSENIIFNFCFLLQIRCHIM